MLICIDVFCSGVTQHFTQINDEDSAVWIRALGLHTGGKRKKQLAAVERESARVAGRLGSTRIYGMGAHRGVNKPTNQTENVTFIYIY